MANVTKTFLSKIAKFESLQELHLPSVSSLNVGYSGLGICGTPYVGPGGRDLRREHLRSEAKAVEVATELVLKSMTGLQRLCIGSMCAMISREGGRDARVQWPWSGNLEKYVLKTLPVLVDEEA